MGTAIAAGIPSGRHDDPSWPAGNPSHIAIASACVRAILFVAMPLYTLWCLLYIYRTSFVVDGHRVFCLWDDAMVSMRYARNLSAGGGFVWNAGAEHVQGYSNLGVTLIMAAIHLLPIDRTRTSLVFQLFNVGLLVYLLWLIRSVARRLFDSEIAADAAALAGMLCAPLAVLGLQGTDVVIVSTIILLAFRAVGESLANTGRWPDRVYLLLAVGVVMRLDFVLVFGVFAAASLWFPRRRYSHFVAVLTLGVILALLLGWQRAYYGNALPNTYYLKLTGMPRLLMAKRGFLGELDSLVTGLATIAAAVAALWMFQRGDRRLWLLWTLVLAFAAYNVRVGGDWIEAYTSRMFAPVLPLLIVLIVGAGWRVFERVTSSSLPECLAFVGVAMLAGMSVGTGTASFEWMYPRTVPMFRELNRSHVRLAWYLAAHSSPDTTVALYWAGITPYFLDRYSIDVLGKNDAHIAQLTVSGFAPGHAKWDWAYIVDERRPDVLEEAALGLDAFPEFRARYVRVDAPGDVAFFARADALKKFGDPGLRVASAAR